MRKILNYSDLSMWDHVDTNSNSGDDASRGLDPTRVKSEHRWVIGPKFVHLPQSEWHTKFKTAIPDICERRSKGTQKIWSEF